MTDREALTQGVREALKTAFSLSNAQVIVANSNGVRPPLPYLTVRVTEHDRNEAVVADWTVHDDDAGTATKAPRGPREATCEVAAYGEDAVEWVEVFPDYVQGHTLTKTVLATAGIVVQGFGAPVDVAALLDTKIEARSIRTLALSYERLGEAFAVGEFVYGELDSTLSSPTGPGSVTIDVIFDPDSPKK